MVTDPHLRPTFFTFFIEHVLTREQRRRDLTATVRRWPPLPPIDAQRIKPPVIAAILENPDPHDRQVYPLFGAEELDWYGIAAKVRYNPGYPGAPTSPSVIPTSAADLTASGASRISCSTSATWPRTTATACSPESQPCRGDRRSQARHHGGGPRRRRITRSRFDTSGRPVGERGLAIVDGHLHRAVIPWFAIARNASAHWSTE